jgi:hypothetical protein
LISTRKPWTRYMTVMERRKVSEAFILHPLVYFSSDTRSDAASRHWESCLHDATSVRVSSAHEWL